MFRVLAALLVLLASLPTAAATSAVALTPHSVGVLGNETREFSARFYDAAGQPAVGENVQFVNDACGNFANGSPVITVKTDATGTATAAFTARNQGITCWLIASAGVAQARWDVLTFTLGQVHFTTAITPPEPRPGQPYVMTVTPMAGAYRIYEADVSARVIAGTAGAFVSPGAGNSGQAGAATFHVTPDARVGDYEIEIQFRSHAERLSMQAPAAPWQDLWWSGMDENGWGLSVVQHRDTLFSVIYAYDAAGKPTWYVMPGGSWNATHTAFAGPVYSPRGSPFSSYNAANLVVGAPVGSITLNIVDGANVALDYAVNGVSGRKNITRQDFGPADISLASNFADMWWGGAAQNGWGLAILQQYRTLFAIWFTYDESGAPTWFVMPSGFWRDGGTYDGRIYRASGSPWLGREYDPRAFRTTEVGAFSLRFNGDTASFDYTIDGRNGTMALSRQPF